MKRRTIAIPVVLVVAVLVAGAIWFARRAPAGEDSLTASGTVEATEARLGFETGGRIAEVFVREGEAVAAGAPLARLDDADLAARREQALARVAAARAQLAELEAGLRPEEIRQAASAAEAARERYEDALRDLERARTLETGGAISPEALQKAETAAGIAREQLEQAQQGLALARRGPREETIDASRARLAEAEAAVTSADAALTDAAILSPHPGIVTVRHREPNEIVAPGAPVVTVMNPADRWVRIYVPENRIGAVHLGDVASIRSDTFPEKEYRGRVTYISPEAEFTPKSVQTAEERVRLVYAVKVAIEGDPELELKPGMPADVELGPSEVEPRRAAQSAAGPLVAARYLVQGEGSWSVARFGMNEIPAARCAALREIPVARGAARRGPS